MNPKRTVAAIALLAIIATVRLFPDEAGSQDLLTAVIVRIVSDYLGFDVDPFNIVLAPDATADYDWSGRVDVYKHGSVRISIDNATRSILMFDDSGSRLVFQGAENGFEYGRTATSWLREYLEQE